LKRQAYYMWNNSYFLATNDSNVFHWQVWSIMNDGQLNIKEIQIDKNLFHVNTIDLHISKVLIRPEQADMT
jgi:hypothetical protein